MVPSSQNSTLLTYGFYAGDPTPDQLAQHFTLDERDLEVIRRKHKDHNQLGYAVQLCTVRFLGTFLNKPTLVPRTVVKYLARQIDVDSRVLKHYTGRLSTLREDQLAIKKTYGYRDYHTKEVLEDLTTFLHARAYLTAESHSTLQDLATGWMMERKILLPGITTLTRLLGMVRERAQRQLFAEIAALLSEEQKHRLDLLLTEKRSGGEVLLDFVRTEPRTRTPASMNVCFDRLDVLRDTGVCELGQQLVFPRRKMDSLARYGAGVKVQTLLQMKEDKRHAILLLTVQHLERTITDQVLDILDDILHRILGKILREEKRQRLAELPTQDQATLALKTAMQIYLAPEHKRLTREELDHKIFSAAPEQKLLRALEVIDLVVKPREERRMEDLKARYLYVRQFLVRFLNTIRLDATAAGQGVKDAFLSLLDLEHRKKVLFSEVDTRVLSGSWRRQCKEKGGLLDRRSYTLALLERFWKSLISREVFVEHSERYHNPRARLLNDQEWENQREKVCQSLGLTADPETFLASLSRTLDHTYQQVALRLPENQALDIISTLKGDRDVPALDRLEKQEEPASLKVLRDQVKPLLPRVDLPELLLEVMGNWTPCETSFTHISESGSRIQHLTGSICAVLTAEACNVGFEPVSKLGQQRFSRDHLWWVYQHYIRPETLAEANRHLVNRQKDIPLAQLWGGGELASVDGLRFKVPVNNLLARPNPKYFGVSRGVTYLNYVSDYGTGFHGIVVPGTLRDSLFILDGLLEQNTELSPTQLTSDSHGASDVVFGLFKLLGYQFSPRLKDLKAIRFYRIDKAADYGALNRLAKHPINLDVIRLHWDEMLRLAGSLVTRTVKASEILRVLQPHGRPSGLGKAVAELGRVLKTLHLLSYLDSEEYRRTIQVQLNLHESRHSLAREVCHGKKGELRKAYREGLENQLGALGLVVNAVILWNTQYLDLALEHLRSTGVEVRAEDVERLSPFLWEHINLLGRYHFEVPEEVARGELRALNLSEESDLWEEET